MLDKLISYAICRFADYFLMPFACYAIDAITPRHCLLATVLILALWRHLLIFHCHAISISGFIRLSPPAFAMSRCFYLMLLIRRMAFSARPGAAFALRDIADFVFISIDVFIPRFFDRLLFMASSIDLRITIRRHIRRLILCIDTLLVRFIDISSFHSRHAAGAASQLPRRKVKR